MKPIRIGIAGLGFIGPAHLEAIRRTPWLQVIAVCHSSFDKAKEKAARLQVPHAYESYEEMISHPDLDAVHICTPNHLHYTMAKAALQMGLHVICEKPLAMTIEEGQELLELAREQGVVHAVHYNIRYYPLVRHMRALRLRGDLGRLYTVSGSYLQDWLFYDSDYNWRLETAMSGDSRVVADIGSHLLDLIEYVSGERVEAVMADLHTIHPTRQKPRTAIETYAGKLAGSAEYDEVPVDTEDYAAILLRFAGGQRGVVSLSQAVAGRKNRLSVEFAGSRQTLAWHSEAPNELWIGYRDAPNQVLMRDPALMDPDAAAITSLPGGHNEGFADTSTHFMREVYAAIREGEAPDTPAYPTFEDGLRDLVLGDAILQSHREQRWVTVV